MTLFKMKLETFILQNMNETCEPYHSYSLQAFIYFIYLHFYTATENLNILRI